jgi:hypothetical protein
MPANKELIATRALHNWFITYSEHVGQNKANAINESDLVVVDVKCKGTREIYITVAATITRHVVSELRGYCLEHVESAGEQYVKSDKKSYVLERALYPADCYTRRELGHSISENEWKDVKYKPVVSLENRLAYHARDKQIHEYYRFARAIVRYSGQVTRIINGREMLCALIGDDTYVIISPAIVKITDEISEKFSPEFCGSVLNDGIDLESDYSALNKREGKMKPVKVKKPGVYQGQPRRHSSHVKDLEAAWEEKGF